MRSPINKPCRSSIQRFDSLGGQKNGVTNAFGELLDASRDVDGVTDQRELQLTSTANGAGDHLTGVDPNADPKLTAESLGDEAVNLHSGAHCGVGMVRKIVGSAEDGHRAVAEELVDVTTGVDDSR